MAITSTQAFTFRLVANGTELDLFEDEDIQISNNSTGLFDIGVLPSDFTRTITLPGTKTNNAFFEHVYDISIDSPFLFATNVKVPAYFDFDSVYLSQGYLQLNKVNVLANKFIDSYEVTIYGTLSSFGREINRLYLTDLTTLEAFNHTSSYANITTGTKASELNQPLSGRRYMSFVNNGVLYVSGGEFIVQMKLSEIYANNYDNTKIPIYKFAGTGTRQTLSSNINGQLAKETPLYDLRGMAFDKFGNTFISDTNQKMIFKINIATNFISLFISSTNTYNPKITSSLLINGGGPFYLAIDNNRNKIYITDYSNGTEATKILVVS